MKWLSGVADVFWPRGLKCLCCDTMSEGEALCSTCRKALQAMRLAPEDAGADGIRSVFRHDGVAKELVLLLKLECLADAALVLAQPIAEEIQHMNLPLNTVLTWVAMPEARRKERGIDHGRIHCETVGQLSGFPIRPLLKRTGKVHTQRGLGREARLRNLNGTFLCEDRLLSPVLLIDDVMTTGATTSACASVLMEAGASRVYVLTATRAMLASRNK